MDRQVLVAHASKYGATAEIAERIGELLRGEGLEARVLSAERVRDLTPYRAVVLGSAVYMGGWQKKAARFLKSKWKALAERQVWLFSSGPTGQGDAAGLLHGWRFPKALQPVADRIRPRDVAVFHGFVNPEKLSPIEKGILERVGASSGDFRDWQAIAAWAATIAEALKAQNLGPEKPV